MQYRRSRALPAILSAQSAGNRVRVNEIVGDARMIGVLGELRIEDGSRFQRPRIGFVVQRLACREIERAENLRLVIVFVAGGERFERVTMRNALLPSFLLGAVAAGPAPAANEAGSTGQKLGIVGQRPLHPAQSAVRPSLVFDTFALPWLAPAAWYLQSIAHPPPLTQVPSSFP